MMTGSGGDGINDGCIHDGGSVSDGSVSDGSCSGEECDGVSDSTRYKMVVVVVVVESW